MSISIKFGTWGKNLGGNNYTGGNNLRSVIMPATSDYALVNENNIGIFVKEKMADQLIVG